MKIDSLKRQHREQEDTLTHAQKELYSTKENLKQLQEDKKQLEQKLLEMSSVGQKETKEMEVQTDLQMKYSYDLYDKEGKYVRTELSNPSLTSVEDPKKSRHKA